MTIFLPSKIVFGTSSREQRSVSLYYIKFVINIKISDIHIPMLCNSSVFISIQGEELTKENLSVFLDDVFAGNDGILKSVDSDLVFEQLQRSLVIFCLFGNLIMIWKKVSFMVFGTMLFKLAFENDIKTLLRNKMSTTKLIVLNSWTSLFVPKARIFKLSTFHYIEFIIKCRSLFWQYFQVCPAKKCIIFIF